MAAEKMEAAITFELLEITTRFQLLHHTQALKHGEIQHFEKVIKWVSVAAGHRQIVRFTAAVTNL